jgi:hypothetical protein
VSYGPQVDYVEVTDLEIRKGGCDRCPDAWQLVGTVRPGSGEGRILRNYCRCLVQRHEEQSPLERAESARTYLLKHPAENRWWVLDAGLENEGRRRQRAGGAP